MHRELPRLKAGLMATPVGEELMVYDLQNRRMSTLSPSVGHVFQALGLGQRRSQAVKELGERFGDFPAAEELLDWCLQELEEAGYLEEGRGQIERRDFLTKWGKVALALPLITSLGAPTPAQACSACVANADCTGMNLCSPASGCCGTPVCEFPGNNCFGNYNCVTGAFLGCSAQPPGLCDVNTDCNVAIAAGGGHSGCCGPLGGSGTCPPGGDQSSCQGFSTYACCGPTS